MTSPVAREIETLEARLLDPEVRASASQLSTLLADDFVEFGSSGRVYDKNAIVAALATETSRAREMLDFRVTMLGPDSALATYRVETASSASLRSSTWIRRDGRWQLRFHQGTTAPTDGATPKLYDSLAPWWPLMSAPEDYAEEAEFYRRALEDACEVKPRTVLELGSGGGNNASHLKAHFEMTLVEPSPGMRAVSRDLNPDCEHVEGDMRNVRLDRVFDAVFVHDAVVYMMSEADLKRAIETAFVHCSPGGAALFAPDHTKENFRSSTDCGGHDGDGRSLRYLEWTRDGAAEGSTYPVEYVYLLRDRDGSTRVEHDRHHEGLFSESTWLRLLKEVGFEGSIHPFSHSEVESGACDVFLAKRPKSKGGRNA